MRCALATPDRGGAVRWELDPIEQLCEAHAEGSRDPYERRHRHIRATTLDRLRVLRVERRTLCGLLLSPPTLLA